MGLPFVEPFYGGANNSKKFDQGVNFAVAGATALEDSFFKEKEITITVANASLAAQLSWFNGFLDKLYHNSSDRKRFFETSLVLMGEIGGNDYNNALFDGETVEMVQSFVPQVIQTISSAINKLIKLGAVTLMVPGNFPLGCLPAFLTDFKSSNEEDYDPKTGCLNWPNSFSQYHNELLQLELDRIRKQNPNINIIYADYYNAAKRLYQSPEKYGGLRACCGGAGPYNVNFIVLCGDQGFSTCEDPSLYMSWDGAHMTEAAYRWIANGLLRGSFTNPRFDSICDLSSSKNAHGFSDH
ncbi:hypothetical protein DH2020_017520 [Rehmannia glutinosa]|uniref:GDSL esterase/lipase n=1 Tax=Rehmannia glutinosa TaxID=99300 RepID=A0ABR0WUW6_REHGL